MAEIIQTSTNRKGNKRCKRNSTRIDLTPMVDLGFLLITFFVFSTSISQPRVMAIITPKEKNIIDSSETPEGRTLSLLLGSHDAVFYYNGRDLNKIATTGYNAAGLRSVIIKKQEDVKSRYGKDSGTIILIKPTPESSYENLVNTLDEMQICEIHTYVLMEASPAELDKINE